MTVKLGLGLRGLAQNLKINLSMLSAPGRSFILILFVLPMMVAGTAVAEESPVNAADAETLVKDRRATAKFVDDLLGDGPVPKVPAKSTPPPPEAGK